MFQLMNKRSPLRKYSYRLIPCSSQWNLPGIHFWWLWENRDGSRAKKSFVKKTEKMQQPEVDKSMFSCIAIEATFNVLSVSWLQRKMFFLSYYIYLLFYSSSRFKHEMAMTWSENGSKTQNVLLTVAAYGAMMRESLACVKVSDLKNFFHTQLFISPRLNCKLISILPPANTTIILFFGKWQVFKRLTREMFSREAAQKNSRIKISYHLCIAYFLNFARTKTSFSIMLNYLQLKLCFFSL